MQQGTLINARRIDKIGVVEAAHLAAEAEQCGVVKAVRIVTPHTVLRRLPVYTNIEAIPDDLKARVQTAFSQEGCHYRERHLLTLAEAFIVGQGSVVVTDGTKHNLLRDSAGEFLSHKRTPDGMERGNRNTFAVNQQVHRRFEDDCLLLRRPWANNFGHWLVDQAMALSYLRHIGALRTNRIVVAKTHPRMREIMLETINVILPDAIVYEHPDLEVWHFRSLDYCMPLHTPPMVKLPAALDCLRRDILAVPVLKVPRPRRVYIVRHGGTRKLANEPEIMALATRYGFEPVSPENMPFVEQATLFSQAQAILGVKGAAMTNILFANERCSLMVMSPARFTDPFFFDITSIRGIAYSEVFGEAVTERTAPSHDEFRVDAGAIDEMIRTTLAPISDTALEAIR